MDQYQTKSKNSQFGDADSSVINQYQPKPKRPYAGPPRPTLLGHDKVIRQLQDQINVLAHNLEISQDENRQMKNRINFLETRINQLNPRRF